MKKQIKKSQFVDDGEGNLLVTGKINPVNKDGKPVGLLADSTPEYQSSDETVLKVAASGPTTFQLKYGGKGTVSITAVGKSISGKDVPGRLDLVIVDDSSDGGDDGDGGADNEATDLGLTLDVETTDVPDEA